MRIWPGKPYPLGANWDGEGVNFALFSEHATGVELCLFDADGPHGQEARVSLQERNGSVWHAYLPDVRPGQLYGFRVHGPWAPREGHRFNPAKLLIDPYARALSGDVNWCDEIFGYPIGDLSEDPPPDGRDSGAHVPKGVVVDTAFTWGDDRPPRVPWHQTVIYECHVKGTSARHPDELHTLPGDLDQAVSL